MSFHKEYLAAALAVRGTGVPESQNDVVATSMQLGISKLLSLVKTRYIEIQIYEFNLHRLVGPPTREKLEPFVEVLDRFESSLRAEVYDDRHLKIVYYDPTQSREVVQSCVVLKRDFKFKEGDILDWEVNKPDRSRPPRGNILYGRFWLHLAGIDRQAIDKNYRVWLGKWHIVPVEEFWWKIGVTIVFGPPISFSVSLLITEGPTIKNVAGTFAIGFLGAMHWIAGTKIR